MKIDKIVYYEYVNILKMGRPCCDTKNPGEITLCTGISDHPGPSLDRRDPRPLPVAADPKTALPFVLRAPGGPGRTFASQLRVLARILFHDEEIPIRARYWPGKNVIVPFSLNSPDFRYTGNRVSYRNLLK